MAPWHRALPVSRACSACPLPTRWPRRGSTPAGLSAGLRKRCCRVTRDAITDRRCRRPLTDAACGDSPPYAATHAARRQREGQLTDDQADYADDHRMNASDDLFGVPPGVIAREESLDVEPLRARIAAFAPRKYRKQRERLFADFRRELHGDEEVQAALLSAIVRVHLPFPLNSPPSFGSPHRRTHQALSRARKMRGPRPLDRVRYAARRRKLERDLERIRTDPLIRRFPANEVEFYTYGEVVCPHGRYRKDCEHIREILVRLDQSSGLLKYQPRRRAALLRELKHAGVDPRKHTPDNFCLSAPSRDDDGQAMPTVPGPGRRIDLRRHRLIEMLLPFLTERGLSLPHILDYIAAILRYCFNDPATPAALQRQRERIRRKAAREQDAERATVRAGQARALQREETSEWVRRALRHNAPVAEAERRTPHDRDIRD